MWFIINTFGRSTCYCIMWFVLYNTILRYKTIRLCTFKYVAFCRPLDCYHVSRKYPIVNNVYSGHYSVDGQLNSLSYMNCLLALYFSTFAIISGRLASWCWPPITRHINTGHLLNVKQSLFGRALHILKRRVQK